jgi:PAS domain S-box-containing protein
VPAGVDISLKERSGALQNRCREVNEIDSVVQELEARIVQTDQEGQQAAGPIPTAVFAKYTGEIISQLPVGVFVWQLEDPDDITSFRLLAMNAAAEEMTGVPAHKVVGTRLADSFKGTVQTELPRICAEVIRTGEPRTIGESPFGAFRGVPGYTSIKAFRLPDNCIGIALENINEQKRESTAVTQLAAIVEGSDDAIIGKTVDGIVVSWNPGAEKVYGYSAEEMIGRPFSLLVPPDRPDEVPMIMEHLLRGESVKHFETVRLRKDGRRIMVALSLSPIRNTAGIVIGASSIARDVTDQKQAEADLQESEERFRATFDLAAVGMAQTSMSGQYLHVNQRLCDIVGYSRDEVLQLKVVQLTHPADYEEELSLIQQVLADKQHTYVMEKRFIRKDGSHVWVNLTVSLVRDSEGVPRYFIKVIEDISERKRAHEEIRHLNEVLERRVTERTALLEAANKELEAFSYSISHDLRAPLRAIDGFSRVLNTRFAEHLAPEAQRYLTRIFKNTQQMGRLIDDLLAFSRLGRQAVTRHPIPVAAIVRQIFRDLQSNEHGGHIDFTLGDLRTCMADSTLLKQVWINLLSNAIKFTRQREVAKIEVGCRKEGAEWIYFVHDNGAGFDMQYAHKLFGVFQRLHSVEDYEGTGVGLAIVQRIVQRHGGRVWAEAALDQGATFSFTLGEADNG